MMNVDRVEVVKDNGWLVCSASGVDVDTFLAIARFVGVITDEV